MTMRNYRFRSELAEMFRAEGRVEAEARGRARALLTVLAARGLPVTESVRERIQACTDCTVLESWLDRSLEATTVEEIFD
ncbi:hypothetical protein [Nonomuraea helvata]|uniref:Uncharacterized protein n=1 Tax=Nonomuraea helvata TaxID=37484 RepID=A0ABV5SFY9_9ACTN